MSNKEKCLFLKVDDEAEQIALAEECKNLRVEKILIQQKHISVPIHFLQCETCIYADHCNGLYCLGGYDQREEICIGIFSSDDKPGITLTVNVRTPENKGYLDSLCDKYLALTKGMLLEDAAKTIESMIESDFK